MMNHLHLERWADVLVRHSTDIRPGDIVRITAQPAAEPLLEAVYRRVLAAGGLPVVNYRPGFLGEAFYELASGEQLDRASPFSRFEAETIDASINIGAVTNLRALDKVDPMRMQRAARAERGSRELFFQRAAVADAPEIGPDLKPLLWTTTLFPKPATTTKASCIGT